MTRFPVFHAIMRGGTPPPFEHSPANSLITLTVRRQLPAARALLISWFSEDHTPVSYVTSSYHVHILTSSYYAYNLDPPVSSSKKTYNFGVACMIYFL